MATTTTQPSSPTPEPAPRHSARRAARPGPLGRIADLAYRHRLLVVLGWVAALGVSILLAAGVGGQFKADYSAPGSDSSAAQRLLQQEFPAQSGDTVDVVFRTD